MIAYVVFEGEKKREGSWWMDGWMDGDFAL